MTLKTPSSVKLGSRPRICWMRAYSSGDRPCSDASCGVILISVSIMDGVRAVWATRSAHSGGLPHESFDQRTKDEEAVGGTESRFDRAIGMGHQADHVVLAIGDAGDGLERSIG